MAEARGGVPEQTTRQRFFCYKCNTEISHVLEDYTCPHCRGGFIEEVHDNPADGASASSSESSGMGGPTPFDFLQLLTGFGGGGGHGGQGGGGPSIRFQSGPGSFQRTRSEGSGASTPTGGMNQFSFVFGPGGGGGGRGGGRGSNPNLDHGNPMEQVLITFLNDLIYGLGGGAPAGGGPIITNLGDYAWGRDGLDAIVTQLMNQMEGTGPPPLAKDKIDLLPDSKISQEQIDRKLQCSVCWDDFKLNEVVKKLECEHVFHPDCIIPWLKLHGTCPICRKDLNGQLQEDPNASPSARFEPMDETQPQSSSMDSSFNRSYSDNNEPPQNTSPRTNRSEPYGRRHSTGDANQNSNNPNPTPAQNPLLQSLNQILTPLLSGQPNRRNDPNSRRQQPQDRRPPGSGGPGPDFDHMDLDFD